MKLIARSLIAFVFCATIFVQAQITSFQHIIIVFQENRTPDNLFYNLCTPPYGKPSSCSAKPRGAQYNIQTRNCLSCKNQRSQEFGFLFVFRNKHWAPVDLGWIQG